MNNKQVFITKNTGEREIFDIEKLISSLKHSGASPEEVQKTAKHIQTELKDGMTTHDIYQHAFSILKEVDKPAAAKYSLRRSIFEMGPTGFPFEDLVAEIFKIKGYETVNDVQVRGKCAEHEIDVIAFNEKESIVMEVKFHNSIGEKTDLKVALYVKARFDDLQGVELSSLGKHHHKMTKGILVTNTKFTINALQYAECAGVSLMGWSYPKEDNIQNLVEKNRLHPVTCLTTLNSVEKKLFLEKEIVLAKNLLDENLLKDFGFSDEKIKEITEEVQAVIA